MKAIWEAVKSLGISSPNQIVGYSTLNWRSPDITWRSANCTKSGWMRIPVPYTKTNKQKTRWPRLQPSSRLSFPPMNLVQEETPPRHQGFLRKELTWITTQWSSVFKFPQLRLSVTNNIQWLLTPEVIKVPS